MSEGIIHCLKYEYRYQSMDFSINIGKYRARISAMILADIIETILYMVPQSQNPI